MKYTTEVEINQPLDKVIELFDNTENLKEWQCELQSLEHISGTPGQPGAKSKLKYRMGKREVEMTETITVRNLPEEFTGTYEAKGASYTIRNSFVPLSENKTRYVSEQEYQFKGFMQLMGLLMPGAFRKQSQKYMNRFKDFAEGKSINP